MIPLSPSRSAFAGQAATANVVPVWTEIVADGDTPVSAFAKQQGWNLEARHMVGQPAEAIAQTADHQDCDLIVMGSHGHTALGALVMGSVTTGVMARTRRPVLVIR